MKQNQKQTTVRLTPEQLKMAREESKRLFGTANVSGYIGYLITNAKKIKLKK